MDAISGLHRGWTKVGKIWVTPAKEYEAKVYMGMCTLPIVVNKFPEFVVCFDADLTSRAQFEAVRVVEAVVGEGAVSRQEELGCLLCSSRLLYQAPLRFPSRRFAVLVFEAKDTSDSGSD